MLEIFAAIFLYWIGHRITRLDTDETEVAFHHAPDEWETRTVRVANDNREN